MFGSFPHGAFVLEPSSLSSHAHRVKLRVRPTRRVLGLSPPRFELTDLLLRHMMGRRFVIALLTLTDRLQPREVLQPLVFPCTSETLLFTFYRNVTPLVKRLPGLIHGILDRFPRTSLSLCYSYLRIRKRLLNAYHRLLQRSSDKRLTVHARVCRVFSGATRGEKNRNEITHQSCLCSPNVCTRAFSLRMKNSMQRKNLV